MRTTGNPIEGTIPPKYETDPFGSQWRIATENASGLWRLEAIGTSNFGEPDSPDAGAETVPRFMPVGVANPQMFASAGLRTEDNADRSTWLIETTGGSVKVIQDLLNGDDRFVPNRLITSPAPPAPAVGPPVAPSPRVSGPGNPIRTGIVKCAMRQLNDDITTRELHMIGIDNGALYHSMANNFGTVTDGRLGTFSRFRTISPWGNVGQTLGGTFGTIVSAAIVAHPSAISVFFVAQSGGVYRLWHTVRFSSDGSWRPAKNVLALSGDAPDGALPDAFKVSAGICPAPQAAVWDQASTETLVALWRPNSLEVKVMRVTQTPLPGAADIYSHLQTIPSGQLAGQFVLRNVVVSARPFPDNVP
jgi:hypothetical protein